MSWLYGITRSERIAAEQLTEGSVCTIEGAADLIQDVVDQYFSDREQKKLDEWETLQVRHNLIAAAYMLFDALARYHCALGHYDETAVECFFHTANKYKQTCEAARLYDDAVDVCGAEAVKSINMDDESAIKYCKEIIEHKKANTQA